LRKNQGCLVAFRYRSPFDLCYVTNKTQTNRCTCYGRHVGSIQCWSALPRGSKILLHNAAQLQLHRNLLEDRVFCRTGRIWSQSPIQDPSFFYYYIADSRLRNVTILTCRFPSEWSKWRYCGTPINVVYRDYC